MAKHAYMYRCNCKRCTAITNNAAAEERAESRGGRAVGLVGDVVMGVTAVSGLVANPDQPPDTDQLNDAHQSQIDGRRQSIPQATRDQGSGRSGSSRPR